MNDSIENMLKSYHCQSQNDYKNALKEIIQEVALLGLWRSKFFEKAAFYGGTALRVLYGLDRFSEDLDFSLLTPDNDFQLLPYLTAIHTELLGHGFDVSVNEMIKTIQSAIQSGFIKAGTKEHLLRINTPASIHQLANKAEQLTIKIEVDIDPPGDFQTETKFLLQPIPFSVIAYRLPDLFAGKISALLFRPWKSRVKGRDWYDLIWYISRDVPVSLKHLNARILQANLSQQKKSYTLEDVRELLTQKIQQIDFEQAKKDVLPFLKNSYSTDVWSQEFFTHIVRQIRANEM